MIYCFLNGVEFDEFEVFFDMEDKVIYKDWWNEEGFFGFVFYLEFKINGEFFVFYLIKDELYILVIFRFCVDVNDLSVGSVESEEVLMMIL